MTKTKKFVQKEIVFLIFLLLLLVLTLLYPNKIKNYPYFIDWKTIFSLSGLLVITTALKESGYFYILSKRMVKKIKTERGLALFLTSLSMGLSTFLTNDISLFIVIPITLSLKKLIKNDLSKFIIMEAMGVNIGSALTPIGNPQNIFLWHKWGISFFNFMVFMLPLTMISFGIIMAFIFVLFKNTKIEVLSGIAEKCSKNDTLFFLSLVILMAYIVGISFEVEKYLFLAIMFFYLIIDRKIILKTDWIVIGLFMAIFIDLKIVAQMPLVSTFIKEINMSLPKNVFLVSTILSQIMSNVPATVFISQFSNNWFAIAYGVNLAGNGFFIASLANIIALRMAHNKKIWVQFHKYSITYFIICFIIIKLALFW